MPMHWGRFQQVVFFLLCVSLVPNGFGNFTLVFLTDVPSHRCVVPGINLTEDWNATIIPIKVVSGEPEPSRCSRYRLDVVRNLSAQGFIPGRDVNLTDLEQEDCVDGWSYSKDVYQSTLVSEFDLVCSDEWKQPFTATVYFIGVLFGSFFSGQLSDRFGRKPVLFATMAVQTFFSFIQVFATSWTMFTILLFFNGLGQMSNFVAALVLGSEIMTGNVRILFSSLGSCLGFAVGYMILPLVAYFLRDWKSLTLASSLPGLLYLPLWSFIPESPRWLLSQGKVEEAEAILRKAAKWNKVKVPNIIFQDYSGNEKKPEPKEKANVTVLLRNGSIRTTTLVFCFVFFTSSTGYYGLSLNTAQLHADPFISCFISAAVEVPAYISSWLILRYFPADRLSSLPCFLEQCRFTSSYYCLKVYQISILHWRLLRNTATGTCITVSRVGTSLAPFLIKLDTYILCLPYIIMGTLAVLSAIAALFLPESFRQPLPETVQQMHERARLKFPCTGKETPIPLEHFDGPL
ncbi:hypothetical protein PBY51_002997 [Eleginops maclovinus]|uniref:Major facilitator superfamily (MFS) profile domain-containing protein n=1 Tax=Eleginops maclovinus TaxID=56733 RepID=A0AAN7XCH1_ELEMC|nr:hypothetical protein PBY51_002997 [Eleginops maclovinus]